MENVQQNPLGTDSIPKLMFKFSVPSIIAMIVGALYNIVDQLFIGQAVGTLGNAATNIAFPLSTSCIAVSLLFGIGAASCFNLSMGRGEKEKSPFYIGNAIIMLFSSGVILFIITQLFLTQILKACGSPNDVLPYAQTYVRITSFGFPFLILSVGGGHIIRADGSPKISMFCNILGSVINVILDAIFIFGFNMGIKGAAVGTVICQLFICAWSTYYFTLGKSNLKLRLKYIRLNKKLLKLIIAIALTPLFMELAAGSIHLVTNKVLKSYGGDLSIGAMTTVTSISLMFLMPIFGLSQGMQTIIAYNHGAKQHKRARKTLFLGIIYGTIVLFIAFMLVQLFPKLFVGIFTKDKTLMNMAVEGIRINLLTLPIVGISVLGAVYFQSVGEAKKSMFLSLLRQVIILIPVILIVPKIYGLKGVWASQPIADFLAMFIVGLFLYKEFKKDKIEEKELSA